MMSLVTITIIISAIGIGIFLVSSINAFKEFGKNNSGSSAGKRGKVSHKQPA